MKKSIEEEKRYLDLVTQDVRGRLRECSYPGCSMSTSKGHVVAESHLKYLAESGHVRVLWDNNHMFREKKSAFSYSFRYMGINKIKEYGWGVPYFCQSHDSKVFEPIEKNPIDLRNEKHLYLLCYRSLLHEITKQQNGLKVSDEIKNNSEWSYLHGKYGRRESVDEIFSLSLPMMMKERDALEACIFNGKKGHLKFITKKIRPSIGFFMSGMSGCYVSVIPQSFSTLVSVAYHKEDMLRAGLRDLIETSHPKSLLKFVSDCAIRNMETWGCSLDFYKRKILPQESYVLSLIDLYKPFNMKNTAMTDFSLFERL